ncbi:MAG TPA: BamA/TamA family outer membrane protein [Bacteroidia bacterium]|nr:BamA/TamA family outer membrane protein [Bacteroidia bacterium]
MHILKNVLSITLFLSLCLIQAKPAHAGTEPVDTVIKAKTQDSTKFLRFYHKVGSIFKDKSFVIAPELGRKPETGVLGGLFWLQVFKLSKNPDSTQRKSNTESYIDYTEKRQLLAQVKNNLIFKNERFFLKGENFYNKFPDQYWGVGNETPLSNQQSVSYDLISINQRLLGRISTRYFLGLIYQYINLSNVTYAKGSPMDTSHVSGSMGAKASGMGFDFLYDSRDNILNSYKGFFLEVSSVFNQKAFGGDHYYNNYTIDLRDFLNFGGRKVLAIQGLVNYNTGDVPFREMAQIGGDMMMRGYYFGRFRDKLMLAAQAEYRFPVWKWIGLTAFVSAGEVAPNFAGLDWDAIHFTGGLCLRIMINKTERLNMGIDSGIGQNTSGLYFNSGEAF